MEAYGSVLVDQAVYTSRNSASVPVFSRSSSVHNGVPGGFLSRSASHQFLGCSAALFPATRPSLFASGPLPAPPTYRSLPPPHLLQQTSPPLLPLPPSRSFSLPSPNPPFSARRAAGPGITARAASKDKKKPRASPTRGSQPGGRSHRETPAASAPGRVPKPVAAAAVMKDESAKDGGDFKDDVYALSPPPSSLPMPKFFIRVREAPSSCPSSPCGGEAVGGEVDAGASDDLCHRWLLQADCCADGSLFCMPRAASGVCFRRVGW